MKLYLNDTSPFARFVLICIVEHELEQPELVWVNPWEWQAELVQKNAYSVVPTLAINSHESLYESSVIVNYLTDQHYLPKSIAEHQIQAFGKMLLETAFRHVSLSRYSPPDTIQHPFIERTDKMLQGALTRVDHIIGLIDRSQSINPFILQLITALDYIDFRLPSMAKRYFTKKAVTLLDDFRFRPSFLTTRPEKLMKQPQCLLSTS